LIFLLLVVEELVDKNGAAAVAVVVHKHEHLK